MQDDSQEKEDLSSEFGNQSQASNADQEESGNSESNSSSSLKAESARESAENQSSPANGTLVELNSMDLDEIGKEDTPDQKRGLSNK